MAVAVGKNKDVLRENETGPAEKKIEQGDCENFDSRVTWFAPPRCTSLFSAESGQSAYILSIGSVRSGRPRLISNSRANAIHKRYKMSSRSRLMAALLRIADLCNRRMSEADLRRAAATASLLSARVVQSCVSDKRWDK